MATRRLLQQLGGRTTAATCTALASAAAVCYTIYHQQQLRSTHLDNYAMQQQPLQIKPDDPPKKPISTWKPPKREEILKSMKSGEEYDLLIIGGGATGMNTH